MERYCRTLEHNGWEETRKLLYKREVDGEVYVVDLSEWDKEGKQQVCITYGPEELGPSW